MFESKYYIDEGNCKLSERRAGMPELLASDFR